MLFERTEFMSRAHNDASLARTSLFDEFPISRLRLGRAPRASIRIHHRFVGNRFVEQVRQDQVRQEQVREEQVRQEWVGQERVRFFAEQIL